MMTPDLFEHTAEAEARSRLGPQCKRLLRYLEQHGTINPLESWNRIGIYRLSARIADLHEAGWVTEQELIKVPNRFGETCRVARYKLIGFGRNDL